MTTKKNICGYDCNHLLDPCYVRHPRMTCDHSITYIDCLCAKDDDKDEVSCWKQYEELQVMLASNPCDFAPIQYL